LSSPDKITNAGEQTDSDEFIGAFTAEVLATLSFYLNDSRHFS